MIKLMQQGINPLVPRVQKMKIRQFVLSWLLLAYFWNEMVNFDSH